MTSISFFFFFPLCGRDNTQISGGFCCVTLFKSGQLLVSRHPTEHMQVVSELALAVAVGHQILLSTMKPGCLLSEPLHGSCFLWTWCPVSGGE